MMLKDIYRLLETEHLQAQGVVDTITQPVVVLDRRICVSTANNAFLKAFAVELDDILGKNFFDLGDGQWDIPELRQLLGSVVPKAAAVIGFEVKHDFPTIGQRTFLVDARRLLQPDDNSTSILVAFDDVTDRQRRDAQKDFIVSEMRHRMKNLFAVVRSLAMQTEAEDCTGVDYRDRFLGRLDVTLRAQEVAAAGEPADLETILRQTVGEAAATRLLCEGPPVKLQGSKVISTSMIFHELATNATKYGALSVPDGGLRVAWGLEDGPNDRKYLKCVWREENGPPAMPPAKNGYGTELIKGLSAHLGGTVEHNFEKRGLTVTVKFPVRQP